MSRLRQNTIHIIKSDLLTQITRQMSKESVEVESLFSYYMKTMDQRILDRARRGEVFELHLHRMLKKYSSNHMYPQLSIDTLKPLDYSSRYCFWNSPRVKGSFNVVVQEDASGRRHITEYDAVTMLQDGLLSYPVVWEISISSEMKPVDKIYERLLPLQDKFEMNIFGYVVVIHNTRNVDEGTALEYQKHGITIMKVSISRGSFYSHIEKIAQQKGVKFL